MALAVTRRRPLPKPSPESDPRFRKLTEDLRRGAAKTKTHVPASKKAAQASAAAKGPANEKAAGAKANQVDKIEQAPAKKPETDSFLALLRSQIAAAMPKTLGDTEDFMKGGSAEQMKGSLKGNVSQKTQDAGGAVKSTSKETPNESNVPTKEVKPIPAEPAPAAPSVNAPEGMPAPKSDTDISLQDSKQDTEAQMKEAQVTPQQLQKANDPRFSAVLTAKDAVAKQADAGPAQYRTAEKAVITQTAAKATADARKGATSLVGIRGGSNSAVLSKQAQAKAKEEAERKQVTDHIEAIYNRTKASVEQKLAALETEAGSMFDSGIDAALKTMTDYVEYRMGLYKADRYSGALGGLKWGKDKLFGLPDEVNAFYEAGRKVFTKTMDDLVVRVAALVERRLKEAKDEVANSQAEIASYVKGLSPNLRKVGEAAQKDVAGRFEELERSIDDKKNQIAQQLADKYKEAFDKANEAIKKIQDENKGLVTAFVEKLGEVIKILREFKDKLMALLKKAANAIDLILADPIGFLGNLIAAIKQGIQQFAKNILKHLAKGFMKWLFGSLAEAGIEIPSDLSLPSILKLVLGVLGITYDRMRAKAVRLIGERAIRVIEKVVDYIKTLVAGGAQALWEKVKEDLSSLKEMVIDAIQNWIIETIVKRAIAKLVTMFNPVGAIIQAILAIYDTVTFLIEKASQLVEFIEAVIDSITAIAQGAIGGAADKIEQALENMIPLLIGFLAQFIGLGGIGKKIKEFITNVQNTVDKAIEKAIAKIVAAFKKLFGGAGKDKDKNADDPEKQAKVEAGIAQLDSEDKAHAHNGKLTRKDVEFIASSVKSHNPVFKSISVKEKGSKWVYMYTASPEEEHEAGERATDGEFTMTDDIWARAVEAVIAGGGTSPGNVHTRLSEVSLQNSTSVLMGLIQRNSYANPTQKAQAQAGAIKGLNQAAKADNGDKIYTYLRSATKAVTDSYPKGALSLQVHHVHEVRQYPVVFIQTRAQRARPKVIAQIDAWLKSLPEARRRREIDNLNAASSSQLNEILKLAIQQQIDDDTTNRPETLPEVEMMILTQEMHIGTTGIHARLRSPLV